MTANVYLHVLGSKRKHKKSNFSTGHFPTPKRRNRFEETKLAYEVFANSLSSNCFEKAY